jgi:dsDNA-specific endonuclease/ATPase MutS2
VRVLSFRQTAELLGLSPDRGEVEVQMGPMRLRVSVSNIERISKLNPPTIAVDLLIQTS